MTAYTVVDVEPDTDAWYEERRNSIGASEVPAVLGISPWSTPLGVYRSKLGIDSDFDPELAYIGHAEEHTIAGWIDRFRPETGRLMPAVMGRSVEYPWLHASFDRLVECDGIVTSVQMKTAHQFAGREWEEGTPNVVEAQIQAEMAVSGAPYAWAAAFVGGRRFHLYRIERNQEYIDAYVIPMTEALWKNHVLTRIPPEPSSVAEVAELWPSVKGKTVNASETVLEAAERRAVLLSDIKAQEAEANALTLAIGTYMGDAEALVNDGRVVLTYKTQQGRRTVDIDGLEQNHPDIAGELIRRGRDYKVMRKGKAA